MSRWHSVGNNAFEHQKSKFKKFLLIIMIVYGMHGVFMFNYIKN